MAGPLANASGSDTLPHVTSSEASSSALTVGAAAVWLDGDLLTLVLTDARRLTVDISRVPWLKWLRDAPAPARAHYAIEQPGGFAIYWPDLDDGIEVAHLLTPFPVG